MTTLSHSHDVFRIHYSLILSLLSMVFCANVGYAQSVATKAGVRTVALSGIGPYANFNSFSYPLINDAGDVTFKGNNALYSETGSTGLRQVVKTGDAAPGFPGLVFSNFDTQSLNTNNQDGVSFIGTAKAGSTERSGIWTQQGTGSLQLIAGSNTQAPGTPAGVTFRGFGRLASSSQQGLVATRGFVQGPGITPLVNDQGVWAQKSTGGPLELIATSGQSTPGISGVFGKSFTDPKINNSGDVAFISNTAADQRTGIWVNSAGSGLSLRAAVGSLSGLSAGQQLAEIDGLSLSLNDSNRVVFSGTLSGSGVSSANDSALLAETNSGFRVALQEGQSLPGLPSDQVLNDFIRGVMNSAGEITAFSYLQGAGINSDNSNVLLSEAGGGGLRIVARDGDQIPGLSVGDFYSHINENGDFEVNDHGVIVFSANLAGAGVSPENDSAYFAELSPGVIKTIVRTGDLLEVAPSVFKKVTGISNSGFLGHYLNNNDEMTFVANFDDHTQGVFVVNVFAVPEVGSNILLALTAILGLIIARKKWRQTA